MEKTRILIADDLGDDEAMDELRRGLEGRAVIAYRRDMGREELLSEIPSYDVLVVRSRTEVDKELIDRAKSLKLVVTATHGSDHVDHRYLDRKGIGFRRVAEQSNAVAELVIGLIVCLARKIPLADKLSKNGAWKKDELIGIEIQGKAIGVVGFGKIGQLVAEKASALGMRVLIHETNLTREKEEKAKALGGEFVPLDRLLKLSDFVTLHLPKTEETSKMIGREQFDMMKDGAFLVNAARGDIVDEEALLENLEKGKLGGAALDVYSVQPPFDKERLRRVVSDGRVVATQHIGGQTREARRGTIKALRKLLEEFLSSKDPSPP
ncbi:MAG: 3-phosphoglycerate dehydrogenase [Candidatus Brockarchaeota archaeon]|nr:3-phosphoglycerate dehydrogenase [Candidatus Brockarchaeota archaeon]